MTLAVLKTETMLNGFVGRSRRGRAAHPVPLKAVSYAVEIVSGLAVVTQKRTFRNDETHPIEATMTFPVGYDSVVSQVKAHIDGRSLVGVAKAKAEARAKYEQALDDGKSTVLHEELLRGLHMVSVGNVRPGGEIVVEARYVSLLSVVDGNARLRVPLTIGAIYGTSPLIPSDDIVSDGAAIQADISVTGADGLTVNGRDASGVSKVSTSSVIDIVVPKASFPSLQASTASGGYVKLDFAEQEAGNAPVDRDIMLDSSGSMKDDGRHRRTKWDATLAGLGAALGKTTLAADTFGVWTFDDECKKRGSATGLAVVELVAKTPFDNRGTQLAEAVHKVAESGSERNILLVTDGKSHTPIDFDRVRKTGARFTVVLIGQAGLEANVGQLAALTGGQMFIVAEDADVASVVATALTSMRSAGNPVVPTTVEATNRTRVVGGMKVSVSYAPDAFAADVKTCEHAAAVAACLAVASLPSETAKAVAEAAGIVTHLTSIVLVDEEGDTQDGLAVTRKVPLASADEALGGGMAFMASASLGLTASGGARRGLMASGGASKGLMRGFKVDGPRVGSPHGDLESFGPSSDASMLMMLDDDAAGGGAPDDLVGAGGGWETFGGSVGRNAFPGSRRTVTTTKIETTVVTEFPAPGAPLVGGGFAGKVTVPAIDWDLAVEIVNGGPVSALPRDQAHALTMLAACVDVIALAQALGVSAIAVAVALVAGRDRATDRQAERVFRKVLGKASAVLLEKAQRSFV